MLACQYMVLTVHTETALEHRWHSDQNQYWYCSYLHSNNRLPSYFLHCSFSQAS